jgi:magnesium transporter
MPPPVVTSRIIRRLLASGVHARAGKLLARVHPAELAPLLADLTPDEIRTVIDLLFEQRRAATLLRELPKEILPQIFDAITDERLAEVMARLEIDDLSELIQYVPEDRRAAVHDQLPAVKRDELLHASLYPPDSAGRAMTTRFLALDEKMTAQEAIDSIRASGESADPVLYLYVIDEARHLKGVVPLRRLVAAPPATPIARLTARETLSVPPEADQEEVAQLVARYDLLAVPVTDADGRLLGIITVDDVIDVITEEATEDIYHLAGLSESDRVFSSARVSIRKRLPWMLVNLATASTAAAVIGVFERTLDQLVTLAVFLPIVAGVGGNGGVQTLTVITRAIALGEIEFSSGLRAIGKEMAVGLVIGLIAGLLAGGLAALWQGNPFLGFVLLLAMMINLTLAGLLGAGVPLVLKALGQDPAVGSGVLVTFFTDAFGFLAFLGIATLLLDRLV